MKKILSIILAVASLLSICTVNAFAASSGNGSSTISTRIYSSYTISIPANIEITETSNSATVTITDVNVEDGYEVNVYISNLEVMDMGAGIKLTHTNGTSTIGCTFSSTENGAMISSSDMPLVTFSTPEFETSTYSKNFYMYPETFGKAGIYTGTMTYTFDCTPIQ